MPGKGLLEMFLWAEVYSSLLLPFSSRSDAQVSAPAHWEEAAAFSVKP